MFVIVMSLSNTLPHIYDIDVIWVVSLWNLEEACIVLGHSFTTGNVENLLEC